MEKIDKELVEKFGQFIKLINQQVKQNEKRSEVSLLREMMLLSADIARMGNAKEKEPKFYKVWNEELKKLKKKYLK